MRIWGRQAAASWWCVLLVALSWTTVLAKDHSPDIKVSKFKNAPLNLNYFEDSDVVLFHDAADNNIYRSTDAGVSWDRVDAIPKGDAYRLTMHEFAPTRAYVLTQDRKHWRTSDRGKTWHKFDAGLPPSAFRDDILHFHAGDGDRVIFNGMDCENILSCNEVSTYTTDNFKRVRTLRPGTAGCWWAKSSRLFTTGSEDLDERRILCIVRDEYSPFKEDQRLLASDDYFKKVDGKVQEFEPELTGARRVQGVVNLAVVQKYILVAATSPNTDEMSLYVTDDAIDWHRAMFPAAHGHKLNQGAFTVLESTNYSIQVDVMNTRPSNPMGVLFTSNSNGTFFTENVEHTNRNTRGNVDFEKISGVQGIFLVNTVKNWEDVEEEAGAEKEIVTQITFDDGRTFQDLKVGDDRLHLHSVTSINNIGRVFSSPAPGLVMAVGNTGSSLKDFDEGHLYVSDNAGLTWKRALKGPHKYEFGDQGSILVAIRNSKKADVGEIRYSLDHGENWEKAKLPDDMRIKPVILTTTQDSTSPKFIIIGTTDGDDPEHRIIAVNFEGLRQRKCDDDDMEDWHARVDKDGKPTCLMGHKQTYRRRKKKADCFVKSEFKDPVPKTEDCACADEDFECDYNFVREDGECVKAGPIVAPPGACKNAKPEDTFKGSSGWRKIPGNTCKRTDGPQKDDPVERECSDMINSPTAPATGEISSTKFVFKDAKLQDFEKIYLERGDSSTQKDETIIARAVEYDSDGLMRIDKTIWRTKDHGKKWKKILKDEEIRGIYPHPHFKDVVFFTTTSKKVIYTTDRTEHFHKFKAPSEPGNSNPLSFHPDKRDWLIWVGKKCEKVDGTEQCYKEASISRDRGDNWRTALRYVRKCEFTGHSAYKFRDVRQIVCLAHEREDGGPDNPLVMVSSNDFFEEDKKVHKTSVKDFATMSEFIVVAAEDEEQGGLRALASMDGEIYAEARLPYNFHVDHQNAYTVLDSSTHAVNLFVATETKQDQRYGSILKSNSNGTSYVMSAPKVNCNNDYFVDFEKIPGLEGVVLINAVAGIDKDQNKVLHTKVSHNDGAQWAFLSPPDEDAEGKAYGCRSRYGDDKCALHLHHYTERVDKKKTFSASSAVGLMLGYGNVGPRLSASVEDADTFMSTDAGITWKSVKKGPWMWQYGDQGSIVVLVPRSSRDRPTKTKTISYTTNEGEEWKDYVFADEEVTVLDVTTLRSGRSRNFLLWCRSDDGDVFSVNLDFSGLADRPCEHPKSGESDYYLWAPRHPAQDDNCLFGHTTQYLRKKADRQCYNDRRIERQYEMHNCTCTREDYECDYNFELDNHGQCNLVPGKEPISAEQWCSDHPDAIEYYEPTGYRRIPLTTCRGGNELDKASTSHPCKGKEEEYERLRGTSGVAIFFAVVIPFAVAGGIGWWVYRNWNDQFGQIRLGESRGLDNDAPWVRYPVIAVSAVVALAAALPLVVSALWRNATSAYERVSGGGGWFGGSRRFTTRDSFARGRGVYSAIDDEGELLGDDSDEDV
ncbi:hypothetical protein ACRALDRAFT_1041229 [Sodiomyces alcalophilus JCM 7366]|uniref:uncharacterized protein n=1 Tax=Sodiomyces alcalophilus JCM 7366 TaxID=591952 RepID=UPI0039B380A6